MSKSYTDGNSIFDKYVKIARTNTLWEAELIKVALESEGVSAFVYNQKDSYNKVNLGDLAVIKIYVKPSDEEKARAIIASIEKGEHELSEENDLNDKTVDASDR